MTEMKAELFDRYVREVGRRLPKKQRDDVQAELHSLLMDALQDRLAERGAEEAATEEDQVAVLKEFGPPAKVAAQYAPSQRYLIGPRFFDLYLLVVVAVAGAITVAHLVLLLLAVWNVESVRDFAAAFGRVFVDGYLGALLSGLGSVTLTFAILERVFPESTYKARTIVTSPVPVIALTRGLSESPFEEDQEEWDPRTLPKIEDEDRIEVGSLVAGIVFTVIALVVFNLFPEWVGVSFVGSIDDAPRAFHTISLLSSVFIETYLPWVNISWIATIGLSIVLLRQGRWQRATRVVDFLLSILSAFILYQMIVGPPLLTMEAIQSESLRDTLGAVLLPMLRFGLIAGLIATIVEAVRKLFRIFRIKPASLYRQIVVKEPANNR
jgi:hypothetical protein